MLKSSSEKSFSPKWSFGPFWTSTLPAHFPTVPRPLPIFSATRFARIVRIRVVNGRATLSLGVLEGAQSFEILIPKNNTQPLSFLCLFGQRAVNGGLNPSWLIFAFFGAPRFSVQRSQLILKGFGASGRNIGAQQARENQPRQIRPPILGPLIWGFPCFFSLRGIPCLFVRSSLRFLGSQGFGRDKKSVEGGKREGRFVILRLCPKC